jgi:hypothetical protein
VTRGLGRPPALIGLLGEKVGAAGRGHGLLKESVTVGSGLTRLVVLPHVFLRLEVIPASREVEQVDAGQATQLLLAVTHWVAAGMGEAAKQFRRVNGHLHLPALRAALDTTIATVTPPKEDAAPDHPGPPPKFHGGRDILFRSS